MGRLPSGNVRRNVRRTKSGRGKKIRSGKTPHKVAIQRVKPLDMSQLAGAFSRQREPPKIDVKLKPRGRDKIIEKRARAKTW